MGCCASTERSSHSPSHHPETTTSPTGLNAPLASAAGYNQNAQPSSIYSPTSSRAPLTAVEPESTVSSPRQSTANHRRSAGTQRSNVGVALSAHYNIPLVSPKMWKSTHKVWTPRLIVKERQDFFDTRVTGRKEVWEALRQVSECIRENDLDTAQGILDAAGITLPTGRLEDGCYDERGELYKVSHVILRDPENVQRDTEPDDATVVGDGTDVKGLDLDKTIDIPDSALGMDATAIDKGKGIADPDSIKIRCRLSHTGTDTLIGVNKTHAVNVLFTRLREQITTPPSARIRIFYLGRELKERQKGTLEDFGWAEGHILNVYLIVPPP